MSRIEHDSFGNIAVPKNHQWGAQTQRSLQHFSIGKEHIPMEIVHALALFKKCAAKTNFSLHLIDRKKMKAIMVTCDEIMMGKFDDEFPLYVWQTGSGTQTNMNMNEVIANQTGLHPNDDINKSQSSNDSFITAVHISACLYLRDHLLPQLDYMIKAWQRKQRQFNKIVKIGRTHLQDAVPLTFGQEFSGYVSLLQDSRRVIVDSMTGLYELAAGGTAVGTGLNSDKRFGPEVASEIAAETRLPFVTAANKFAALSSHNAIVKCSDALKILATNLMKIANDIRWMSSTSIGELAIPANEPGSSIMPGKVNPTQCEALVMVSIQVMANNTAITFANSQGNFELNVCKPLMAYNLFQSMYLLTDACKNTTLFCIEGLKVNEDRVSSFIEKSLVLVTALSPVIGYEKAAKMSHYAQENNTTLRKANQALKYMEDKEMARLLDPQKMV